MLELSFPVCGEAVPVHVATHPEDLGHFQAWVRDQRGPVAVDTETKGLDILGGDPGYVRTVQFGTEREAWVLPTELGAPFRFAAKQALRNLPSLAGHNWAGFDAVALAAYLSMDLDELCRKAIDTQILAKLIDPRQVMEGGIGSGLKPLSAHYIDPSAPDTQGDLTAVFRSLKLTKATGWAGIDLFHPTYLSYAGGDVILTSRLRTILLAEVDRLGVRRKLVEYEHEISRICAHMQYKGMVLDQDYTRTLQAELTQEEETYSAIARRYGVTSINSSRQVAEALVGMGETLTEKTDSGALKVDKAVLSALADLSLQGERLGVRKPNPLADAIIRSKRAGKWRSTYADTMLETMDADGRIHPFIQTLQARTGRMSVTRPALQTLPSSDAMIRRCLLAEEGHVIVSTDFAAVELRVLAALANVKQMKRAINAGEDLHSFTARMVFGENFTKEHRKISKGIAFGKVYGGGAATIQRQTGAPMAEVRAAMAAYDRVYPEVRRASNRWQREAFETGMVHVSVTGRHLPLDRHRTYAVVNYACQSAARDVLGQSLINMEERGLLPYLRLPVHDEVVASVPEDQAPELARAIEECMTFDLFGVPIDAEAEIGKRSWGSLYGAAA